MVTVRIHPWIDGATGKRLALELRSPAAPTCQPAHSSRYQRLRWPLGPVGSDQRNLLP